MPPYVHKSSPTNVIEGNRISENHRICIQDIDTGETFTFSLVPPGDMDTRNGNISTQTSLGCALAGHPPGSLVEWRAPSRLRKFIVTSISPIKGSFQQRVE
jgi:regulator of nucleoside diphosphate kinase